MKKTTIALGIVVALSACGGGTPTPAATPAPASASGSASGSGSGSASGSAPAPGAAPSSTPAPSAPPATGGSVLIGDIAKAKSFDPKAAIASIQDGLLSCYNKERGGKPELRGKLKMRAIVNQAGTVVDAEPEEGGLSKEAGLVDCVTVILKATPFPKPGGMATVTIPLLFRP
jgi:hypothetical protein